MTTMVEKVARAIYEKAMAQNPLTPLGMLSDWPSWDDLPENHREKARGEARAAIEALMEPTESMLDAGDAADGYDVYVGVWTAMIQAALKEGQ